MKIVINARIIRTSTGRYVERLLHYLQQVDKNNEYVVILSREDFDWWQPDAANFKKVSFNFRRYSLLSQFQMARLLYKARGDVVHFTFQPDVFTPLVAFLYWKPKIMTIHDLTQLRIKNRKRNKVVFEVLFYVFKVLLRLNTWTMKAIITPSKFVKNDVNKYLNFPANKIFATYLSADLAVQKPVPRPIDNLQNTDFILYVGTAHTHKNLPALVDAFELLQKKHPALHLVMAGKKEPVFHDRLERYVKGKGLENVDILGFVEDSELAWLYQNCKAYVFPSISEGFGLPGLEAMSFGAAVVSSRATCLPEIYGDAAHYFDPTDPGDMFRAINDVLTDTKLREKLINEGSKQLKKYSWKVMAEQTLDIYEQTAHK